MCGLFGSTDREQFLRLAEANSYRGSHSWSYCSFTGRQLTEVNKGFGAFPYSQDMAGDDWLRIGHVQAPTTDSRDYDSIHPAAIGSERLWHNGIIKDHIVSKWKESSAHNTTWDTKLLLEQLRNNSWDALKEADGSFACVFYSEGKLYLFRNSNSPLFVNGSDFSSVKFKKAVELPANIVYHYVNGEWFPTDKEFSTSNTFYWSYE